MKGPNKHVKHLNKMRLVRKCDGNLFFSLRATIHYNATVKIWKDATGYEEPDKIIKFNMSFLLTSLQ